MIRSPVIDTERVERYDQRAESAECGIGLGVELLCKRKVAIQAAARERFGEHLPTIGRGKRDGVRRQWGR